MRLQRLAFVGVLLAGGLAFAQTPKKILFDHTGYEDAGTSAYWIIDTHEPDPLPAAPTAETDWNGGISAWAFDLYTKGYKVQTLPASGGRITYNDATNSMDLKNYAAFIIPERYKHFTAAEMTAIVSYVQNGGGLYLMGNHIGASRATSIDPSSTDAYTVFNELLASSGGQAFGFTYVAGHGPGDAAANTVSNAFTTASGPIEDAIVRGANGSLASMDFHSYSYLNLTGSNANARPILATQVSGDSSSNYFIVAATVGSGRVMAISDSAPSDDGSTTTSGKSLHVSYSINSNRAFHLNTVDWLASASSSLPGTVTASITQPSTDLSVSSGNTVSFAASATDSNSSATLSYAWNFGDGSTATGPNVTHTFTNTGTASVTDTVTLTVSDNLGASASATRKVTVNYVQNTGTATITAPAANVTVASGSSVAFAGTFSGGSAPLSYSWNFGDGSTATGASASHVFTNTGTTAKACTVTFTVTDGTGTSSSATRVVTVNPAALPGTQLVANPGFESGATSWSGTTGDIGAWSASGEAPHAGSQSAWLCGNGSTATETLYQDVAIPASATSATLSFWMHIDTAESGSTVYDTLLVRALNTSGNVLQTLGTWSNVNANSGYVQKSFDLTGLKGQTVRIHFKGVEDASYQTSFVIDDVTLTVK